MSNMTFSPTHRFATAKEAALAYAAGKPTLPDGEYKNIPVVRVSDILTAKGWRRIFGFPFKTANSGQECATMSYPLEGPYAQSFADQYGDIQKGDRLRVTVSRGYVQRVRLVEAIDFGKFSLSPKLPEQAEEYVDEDTGEVIAMASGDDADAAALLAARRAAGQPIAEMGVQPF